MNLTTVIPDLLDAVNSLKKEDQKELFDYMQTRYLLEKPSEKYKREALAQIKKALKRKNWH